MSIYKGDKKVAGLGATRRNIGEIVSSILPLTDAGLHLLDGAVINGNGIYSKFVTYIAGLVSSYPNLFISESDWQSSVNTYGVCGKFVYDSANNTVRLPKITGIIEGTTDLSALGSLVEAGLPNITGSANIYKIGYNGIGDASGAFYLSTGTRAGSGAAETGNNVAINFNASRSSSVYGNSNTVQPQTIKAYYYICVAASVKPNIEADMDQIASDLNLKAGTDLGNLTDAGKSLAAGLGMPSGDTYINLTPGASGASYTAPSNGWMYAVNTPTANAQFLAIYNSANVEVAVMWSVSTSTLYVSWPVVKGDSYRIGYSSGTLVRVLFFYAEGSKSEA